MGETDLRTDGGTVYEISQWQFVPHPDYQNNQSYFDVAVIYLTVSLAFNKYTKPICLPKAEESDCTLAENLFVNLLG